MELNLLSLTEENYIKAIYNLSEQSSDFSAGTNELAGYLGLKPGTITETIKRLSEKGLIAYEKYQPLRLTIIGKSLALQIIRNQRLWKTYLVKRMGFGWEEIDEMAHQLEHIRSAKLIDRMDELLGYPLFDPHGDPIPDKRGNMRGRCFIALDRAHAGQDYRITAVNDHSEKFIRYMNKIGLQIGDQIHIEEVEEYDGSMTVLVNSQKNFLIPSSLAENILVTAELHCCAFEQNDSAPPCLNKTFPVN
jgi:DtxR family Mn-dependent transcriptional regulator